MLYFSYCWVKGDVVLDIIIVEDEIFYQDKIKKIIRKTLTNILEQVNIEIYTSYNSKLEKRISDLSKKTIYILDIELKNSISGIEIAKHIRKKDWNSEIIFLTSHDKMFESVHRKIHNIFTFIEKFNEMDKQLSDSIKLIATTKQDNKMFKYSTRSINLQIYLKDILYIYRDKNERKLIIRTTTNKFYINMSLIDIMEKLDSRFSFCHRSCIVNKNRVVKYNWKTGNFILDTGEIVDLLSRKYKIKVVKDESN